VAVDAEAVEASVQIDWRSCCDREWRGLGRHSALGMLSPIDDETVPRDRSGYVGVGSAR